MKRPVDLFLCLCLLTFSSVVLGETVSESELVDRDGMFFKKFSNEPFSGTVTGRVQVEVKNGKPDGHYTLYWENGQLRTVGFYRMGIREGHWIYYDIDGLKESEGYWKNDEFDGVWTYYFRDGRVDYILIFKDGEIQKYKDVN